MLIDRRIVVAGSLAALSIAGCDARVAERSSRRVLWAATVRTKPLSERIAACVETTVSTLREIGGYGSVGPEIFADSFDQLPARKAGKRAGESLDRWLPASSRQLPKRRGQSSEGN